MEFYVTQVSSLITLLALGGLSACSDAVRGSDGVFGAGGSAPAGTSGTGSASAGASATGGNGAAGTLSDVSPNAGMAGSFGVEGGSAGAAGASGATSGASGSSAGSGGAPVELPPAAPEGVVPSQEYPPSKVNLPKSDWQSGLVSPTLESEHHNQPAVINGYLQLTGNARFSIYDISNPAAPQQLAHLLSPRDCSGCEAEGHQVSFAKYGSKLYTVTIQGKGVDIWDISNSRAPTHLKSVDIEGINFGDFTAAVWGVAWQGTNIFVGGTNTGLHVIDAKDPSNASLVGRLANVGGVSAGPLFAVGNLLVVTTPKSSAGVATVDISNPRQPVLLDSISPDKESYIGGFYGHHAYLLNPIRVYDVLSDPTDIKLISSGTVGGYFEYMSFQDGFMFAGRIRPEPGATKIDVTDPTKHVVKSVILGRRNLKENDDQFTIAIGNLLVLSDDQLSPETNKHAGTVIAVHDTARDTTPPRVDTIVPKPGAVGQAPTTRVGVSFTDNIELATVDARSFVVRPVGGQALAGSWSVTMSVLNFDPDEDLKANTTYEIVLPKGGIKDYVGNGIAEEFRSTFTTR